MRWYGKCAGVENFHFFGDYLKLTYNRVVTLVAITGTTILVPYLLIQVATTHLKIGHP